jgi:Ser-tRNA(Ala) deacylase AlaX
MPYKSMFHNFTVGMSSGTIGWSMKATKKTQMSEEAVIKKLQQSAWYKALSEKVRKRVDAYPPTKKYRMKTTGRIVTLVSYDEDKNGDCNSVTVDLSRDDNPSLLFEREVFGVEFDELEPINPSENLKN